MAVDSVISTRRDEGSTPAASMRQQALREVGEPQLPGREVEADDVVDTAGAPHLALGQQLFHDPIPDGADEAHLLGDGDEL
jgi:hypothetical protein